ncbi:2-polyprenyl-6-methoxyphenol hydroxylase-like FAD-dependent oxidoreductase [Mycobacterium frederiksbergense]|uniref:2-polyprenyl-6-methoxyphenol hydroxylase-like FAD-dependent oxidoreductase n=1 Tax=Mycolicibacterium frederiksbergense TaxID=117567 RepID=A0ABT6L653_9MYCO|nr:FAD-dependent oxidoreductase [Mycolicibacterium frederiksbergense]MDH6198405.1 2-polyprenyl-6-methoxyphenol hydroxylase-like FAD-dependent oxidoreductase [Mycolicibacterium frederiksbergense]
MTNRERVEHAKSTDVLVIGAGPTGLTLAATLRNHGIDVTVVDKLPEGANTSRAAAVAARTLEVLERLDVSRRMIAEGLIAPTFTMRAGDRVLIPVDFSELPTAYPFTLMLSQANTERILLQRLTELGGTVIRPLTLQHVEQEAEGVTATFTDGTAIRARYVVGADGIHSRVREQAGIGFTGGEYPESFALADVRLAAPLDDEGVILFYAKTGLTVVAPLPGDVFRIVAPAADAPERPTVPYVQRLLDQRGFGPGKTVVTEVIWGSRFRIQHRVADTYRAGRLLLAGDAAHVHSPAGGQGMNLGVQDAVALADALAAVLTGAPDTVLDDYSAARRPIAQQVLSLTGQLTRVATLPPPLRPVRNVLMELASHLPVVRHQLAWRLSGLVYR